VQKYIFSLLLFILGLHAFGRASDDYVLLLSSSHQKALSVTQYGNTSIGGTLGNAVGHVNGNPITLINGASVTAMNIYVNNNGGGCSLTLGIYNDLAGWPFQLMAQATSGPVTIGWNKFPLNANLPSGTYWLTFVPSGGYLGFNYAQDGLTYVYDNLAFTTSLPIKFINDSSVVETTNIDMSFYIDAFPYSPPPPTPTYLFPIPNGYLLPPMGWFDWEAVGPGFMTEATAKSVADSLVSKGLSTLGYKNVNLDDGWQAATRSVGHLVPDPTRFPDGMAALATYIHSEGLSLGLYTAQGVSTCNFYPGSYGNEIQDANDMASWGVDYLKDDNCNPPPTDYYIPYYNMSHALLNNSSHRNIFYSLCYRTIVDPLYGIANMQRTGGDSSSATWASALYKIDNNSIYAPWSKPGNINDPCELSVGWGVMTNTEDAAEFSMYCEMASPLLLTQFPNSMPATTLATISNTELIAVDQDPLVNQGVTVEVSDAGSSQTFSKILTGTNVRAVALFNRDSSSEPVTVHFTNCGLPAGSYHVRDLWAHSDLGIFANYYSCTVASHAVSMIKVTP
jgi:hypothetical protein